MFQSGNMGIGVTLAAGCILLFTSSRLGMRLCQKQLLHFFPEEFFFDSKQSFYYNSVPKLELGNGVP